MSDKLTQQLQKMEQQYDTLKKEFSSDGKVTREELLVLKSVQSKLQGFRKKVVGNSGSQNIAQSNASSKLSSGAPVPAKQVSLGALRWEGKYKGKLWGLTDKSGAIARGGKLKFMARLNSLGERALVAIAELETVAGDWNADVDAVLEAAVQAGKDLKALKKSQPAMRKRMKNDPDFFGDVNGYLVALKGAEKIVGRIGKAEKDYNQAVILLEAEVAAKQGDDAGEDAKSKQGAVNAKEAEIKEAKRIFGDVMKLVIQVAKQDWKGLATKAVSHLADKYVVASYASELKELKKELSAAKNKVKAFKTKELVKRIEAAAVGVESAVIDFENAQAELTTALGALKRHQANATNELKESSSTAIGGKLLVQRAEQLHSITMARNSCGRYIRESAVVSKNIAQISLNYIQMTSWLASAAKTDPAFGPNTPYGKMLALSAGSNASKLDNWVAWDKHVRSECTKALKRVTDPGPKGPMAPFDEGITVLDEGLTAPN